MKKNINIHALIMAGGKGTRFWPESTEKKPKQYLKLISSNSLLEETLLRFDDFIPNKNRYIITVKEQEKLAKQSSKGKVGANNILFEPSGRNTAPCILMSLAALEAKKVSLDDIVSIVPSDHVILNKQGFQDTIKKAAQFASETSQIVTIGITPTFPHTGFGYIQKGKLLDEQAFKVSRFKEKPHFELATEYVRSGQYLWNAGMFVAPIRVFLEEFETHAPEMYAHYKDLVKVINDPVKLAKVYDKLQSDSIDYAIMEKSDRIAVMPANFDWNDLGSWDALSSVIDETHGNTVVKSSGELFLNSTDNVIYAPGKFVSLINMDKHIVVVNDNVVMVCPVKDAQEIKKVVENLKKTRPELL